ncbi:hypothetical protein LSCM4_07205 [Leishmania orientalis]|uniref:BD-FAE-like domain-containing protein n=1 Tax=Leishmania orientalis TaxID=2249476 RepID=A0A836HU77_9TRYP|nr:hypothetical protein LSCM4_07205 [Leishmania orientalis]
MLPYAIRQLVWMLTSALQLIYALSTGVVWVTQMLRLFAYGACVGVCFIPHWWWYLTSPNIIRRVSYRSSEKTKRRNVLRMLEAEGLALRDVLHQDAYAQATWPPEQMQPKPSPAAAAAAARRRRRRATVAVSGHQGDATIDSIGSQPRRRRLASSIPPSALCRDAEEEASAVLERLHSVSGEHNLPQTVDGEVDDRAVFQMHPPSPPSPLRHRDALDRGDAQRTQLGPDSCDETGTLPLFLQRRRHRHCRPPALHSALSGTVCGGTDAPKSHPPSGTALDRLMDAATCDLSPAESSAMRSLSLQRHQSPHNQRHTTQDNAAHRSCEPGEGTEKQREVRGNDSVAAVACAEARASSSSSGGARNQPHKLQRITTGDRASTLRTAPAHSVEEQMSGRSLPGSRQRVRGYEGRPVYYETLPEATPSSDPMLRDVLAAFREAGTSETTVGLSAADQPSGPRSRRHFSGAAGRRPLRRSGAPPPPRRGLAVREPPAQPQRVPHDRTLPEEALLEGLEEEDEEDRMNLHNRATVDIVLPAPLDAIMKTLEYAQQSKRLRRKRFPIAIDVSGAVWIIGSHLWSTMMARVLAHRGYVVFCPDYRNFPQTTMEGMTLDISDAIAWVLNNAERYNGDLNNVTLIGQSAGAHLTMMSLLSQAQLSAYRCNAKQGIHEGVPPPSDVAYNVPRYNPRESIHRYVGLSGVYNIEGLVDHFQAGGLSAGVLYQIAGGREQLARYSIHAYFDDRRGGDTGEVLPDNIFDFFPQRMFFVHGDADKSAPVTESSSLVGKLRAAQERYTLRRHVRNEEARRHAQRSRRLLPDALTAAAGEVKSRSTTIAAGALPSSSEGLWSQRSTAVDFDSVGSTAALAAQRALGTATKLASSREIIFAHDKGLAHPDVTPDVVQPQQQQHAAAPPPASILSPTTISPIIPPSREDHSQPPVELGFLVISGGRHSDAFVDECIAAGRSCCVDFLCDYESAIDYHSNALEPVVYGPDLESAGGGSVCPSSTAVVDKTPLSWTHGSDTSAMPDAVLPLAVPYEDRSLPLRLCRMISPF